MKRRQRLLIDAYCGVGLAADGYIRAGFDDVVGFDINPQPNYPYNFVQVDAINILTFFDEIDFSAYSAVHLSPPCQPFTRASHLRSAQGGESKYADLLTPTLALLRGKSVPWVVENVPGAPGMDGAVVECGSAYGLGVRRHRLFLSNVPLVGSGCDHKGQGRPWGVYHVPGDSIPQGGRTARDAAHGREVMGVDRDVTWDELKEGFPPAYTEHIGRQVLEALTERAA